MNFGMKVGIIKWRHFAKFKQNREKYMVRKRENLNFKKMLKIGVTLKTTRIRSLFKKFKNPHVKTLQKTVSKFSIKGAEFCFVCCGHLRVVSKDSIAANGFAL